MTYKIFLAAKFPDNPEKWCRRRRKWQLQSVMLYKQSQEREIPRWKSNSYFLHQQVNEWFDVKEICISKEI